MKTHGLDFVANEKDVVLLRQVADGLEVALWRDDNAEDLSASCRRTSVNDVPSLALDGLDQEGRHILGTSAQDSSFKVLHVPVPDDLLLPLRIYEVGTNAADEGAEVVS